MAARTRWILGASLLGLVVFGPGVRELIRLSRMQHRLDRRLSALAVEREALAREERRLRSDSTYIEGLIRSTFKVAKPGEYVVPVQGESRDQ